MVLEAEDEEDGGSSLIGCPVLVTERLVMRPPHVDDIPDLARFAANRRIADMLARMPHPYGEAEAHAFVAAAAERTEGCVYAVTSAENGALLGCAALNVNASGLEIGYWIGEPHWGRGYATEAAHALVDHGFRASGARLMQASCRVINPASRRVVQKCGFHYAGQGMVHSLAAGRVAVERYVLDRKTWTSLKSWAAA